MHSYRSHDSTSCHVTARDISRFHSVIFGTAHRYSVKSRLSNLESKNTSFVNISSSLHLMLLFNGKRLFTDFDCFIYFADGKIVQSMGHAL